VHKAQKQLTSSNERQSLTVLIGLRNSWRAV